MSELEVGRTLLLFLWSFGLAGIEIEIEGGVGWAERLPTWYFKRGLTGRVYGVVMGQRPLTGYHVYAFTIPLLILHLPYVMGVDWTLAGELRTIATYFVLAVVWDYLWFVLNPAYTVRRFRRGNVWWFEVPWIWRFPLDYYLSILLSIGLAGLAAVADGDASPLWRHLWMLAGLAVLVALVVLLAPLYHRWYRHMRREGADDRAATPDLPAARARGGLVRRRAGAAAAGAEDPVRVVARLDVQEPLEVRAVVAARPLVEPRLGEVRVRAAGPVRVDDRPGPVDPFRGRREALRARPPRRA